MYRDYGSSVRNLFTSGARLSRVSFQSFLPSIQPTFWWVNPNSHHSPTNSPHLLNGARISDIEAQQHRERRWEISKLQVCLLSRGEEKKWIVCSHPIILHSSWIQATQSTQRKRHDRSRDISRYAHLQRQGQIFDWQSSASNKDSVHGLRHWKTMGSNECLH